MKMFSLGVLTPATASYWDLEVMPLHVQRSIIVAVKRVRDNLGRKIEGVYFRANYRKNTVHIIFETAKLGYDFDIEDTLANLYFTIMDIDDFVEHEVKQRPFGGANF